MLTRSCFSMLPQRLPPGHSVQSPPRSGNSATQTLANLSAHLHRLPTPPPYLRRMRLLPAGVRRCHEALSGESCWQRYHEASSGESCWQECHEASSGRACWQRLTKTRTKKPCTRSREQRSHVQEATHKEAGHTKAGHKKKPAQRKLCTEECVLETGIEPVRTFLPTGF